jgi:hypothetical protein
LSHGESLYRVFISHSSVDTWVAKQLAQRIEAGGAATFLDESDIAYGDDFEARILEAARNSEELLVLLTPWAIERPYIWLEMGVFWGRGKRIIGVLHGLTAKELTTREGIPALLKRIDLVDINRVDLYFAQVAARVKGAGADHD